MPTTKTKPDKAKAIRCLLNVQRMPITRFELPADRNGAKSARARRAILGHIADSANPDGTGSYVSDSYLRSKTGFTERHIISLRESLHALGLLDWTDKRGYAGEKKGWGSNLYTVKFENWPRRNFIRKIFEKPELNPEVSNPEVHNSNLNPEVLELNPEVSATEMLLNPEISELNPEAMVSDNRLSLPPLESTALPTAQTEPKGLAGWMASHYGQEKAEILTVSNKERKQIEELSENYSAEAIRKVWAYWIKNRPRGLDKLVHIVNAFVKEFTGAIEALGSAKREYSAEEIQAAIEGNVQKRQADNKKRLAAIAQERELAAVGEPF